MVGGRRAECPIACNDAHAAANDGCEEGACANGELMCPDNPLGEPPPTWLKLLKLNAVGFNGEDGGDGRANEDALPPDVAALEDSREPNISDGENNLDEPVTFA